MYTFAKSCTYWMNILRSFVVPDDCTSVEYSTNPWGWSRFYIVIGVLLSTGVGRFSQIDAQRVGLNSGIAIIGIGSGIFTDAPERQLSKMARM